MEASLRLGHLLEKGHLAKSLNALTKRMERRRCVINRSLLSNYLRVMNCCHWFQKSFILIIILVSFTLVYNVEPDYLHPV